MKYSIELKVGLVTSTFKVTHALKAEFESRFFEEGTFKLGMFRRCVVFADTSGDEFHPLNLVALKARDAINCCRDILLHALILTSTPIFCPNLLGKNHPIQP